MLDIKRIISILLVCLTILTTTLTTVYASNIYNTLPFNTYKFRPYASAYHAIDDGSFSSKGLIDGAYFFVTAKLKYNSYPDDMDSFTSYKYTLYSIVPNSYNFDGVYIDVGVEPQSSHLRLSNTLNDGRNVTYRLNIYEYDLSSDYLNPDNDTSTWSWTGTYSSSTGGFMNFAFDNKHSDCFPTYLSGSRTFPEYILVSNVDILDYDGNVIQYGNYYSMMDFFTRDLKEGFLIDYSGHETGVGETPTEGNSSDEQLKVSGNILENVKNLLSTVFNLPSKIAEAIGGFFTNLGDIIKNAFIDFGNFLMDGLKFLFIPPEDWDPFLNIKSTFNNLFGWFDDVQKIVAKIYTSSYYGSENVAPTVNVTVFGKTVSIFDWEFYKEYRGLAHDVITVICWLTFILRIYKRIPGFIQGYQNYETKH